MDTISLYIPVLLNLILGKLMKMYPKIANGLIFWVNWIVNIIANVTVLHPATAHAGGFGSKIGGFILNPVVLSFLQSIIATGFHSTVKNTWETIKEAKK